MPVWLDVECEEAARRAGRHRVRNFGVTLDSWFILALLNLLNNSVRMGMT